MNSVAEARTDARLVALRETGLLDSRQEPRFDRLTRVVAAALGVPVSMIALVDAERQFFKSATGLASPWKERRQTPLSHSFCKHVVDTEAPLVVSNSRLDPRVSSNLAIDELGVAAYAGVPISDPNGVIIGSLCAIDGSPREWSAADVSLLEDVAALVQREIADRREADAVVEAEKSIRTILNALPHMVWAASRDGLAEGFNNRWHAFTGTSADAEEPQNWDAFCHPDDRADLMTGWRHAYVTEQPFEGEFRLRHHDGSHRWMLVRILPLRAEDGSIERWFGSCTDIQALKDLAEENGIMRRELAGDLIERLSTKAAYAGGTEFNEIRDLIRSLRQIGGVEQ